MDLDQLLPPSRVQIAPYRVENADDEAQTTPGGGAVAGPEQTLPRRMHL